MAEDPNQLAPGWTQDADGNFVFAPTAEQRAGIKQSNGDVLRFGNDGQTYVDQAPHGVLDQIAKYAPYAIMATMGYGALSDAGVLGAAGAGGGAGGGGGAALPATLSSPAGMIAGGVPETVAAATAGTGVGATVAAPSIISTIAGEAGRRGIMSKVGSAAHDVAGTVASGINQATADAAHNRGVKLTYAQEQEKLRQQAADDFQRQMIAREEENRAANKSAMQRVQQDSYNLQRTPYTPPTIHSNVAGVKDQTLPNFGIGRTHGPTPDEIAALTADRDQARDRLMSGSQLPPLQDASQSPFFTQPNKNLNPGTMERIGQIAGPAVSIWDKIAKYL